MITDRYKAQAHRSLFRRKWTSALMLALCAITFLIVVLPLLSVFAQVLIKGLPYLDFNFFTKLPAPLGDTGGGLGNALLGTGILVLLASSIGVPIGIATGTYLSEYGHKSFLSHCIRFSVDLLASIPSIVIGLFVYVILVAPMKSFSTLAGGVALAFLMIPTVCRTTEEILKLVPVHLREAGLGLGLSRSKVIIFIVLRGSLRPISTGVVLAIARVSGETAPLLFTALSSRFWYNGLGQPIASLPVQIYSYAISPFEEWQNQAWAGAFVLVAFVVVINLTLRLWLGPKNSSGAI